MLCRSEESALARVPTWVAENGLTLYPEKTRLVDATQPGAFDFLGYHFERGYRWPRRKAMDRLKDKVRELTPRTSGESLEATITRINDMLRGWFGYFRHRHRTTRLGFIRATEVIELLIARDLANQARVKQALEILPDRAIRELGDEDIAQWVAVRVNDDITIDLMTEACGVTYEEATSGIEIAHFDSVPIPFAGAALLLKMKQGAREKDAADRSFLQQLLRAEGASSPSRPTNPRRAAHTFRRVRCR